MALSASSTYTQTLVTHRLTSASASASTDSSSSTTPIPQGLAPLPAKPKFNGSELRRTKSRTPVQATAREAVNTDLSLESTISKVGEEIATASEEILDAVDSVIEDGPTGARRSRAGKRNSRTSRRRALIMCLALGMVRPCASNAVNGMRDGMKEGGNELRRTVSEFPPMVRTSSMQVPVSGLMSQVSLATSLKQVNLLGQQEDLQKLTTLQ